MKRKAQQTFFILIVGVNAAVVDVQKHGGFFSVLIIGKDPDDPLLLRYEHTIGAVASVSDYDRAIEIQIRERAFSANWQRGLEDLFLTT